MPLDIEIATNGEVQSVVVQEARGLARRFFKRRGNHSEVHLKEYDLMILLGVAINKGIELERARGRR